MHWNGCGPPGIVTQASTIITGEARSVFAPGATMTRPASWRVQHVETSAGPLFVRRREGSGVPLVLWPSIFFDHSLYLGLTEWLPNPMIMLDAPGHGRSQGCPDPLTLELCAQAQEEVLRELDIPAAIAVGTSWGGLVAMTHALPDVRNRPYRPGRRL
jgi:pimeloyl-ACP methyl ester carboxylesterase